MAGGTAVATSAVSKAEINRDGEVIVSNDANSYLALSPEKITDKLVTDIDTTVFATGTPKPKNNDTVVTVENRLKQDFGQLQFSIDAGRTVGLDVPITTEASSRSLRAGTEESITAGLTTIKQDPELGYTVSVGDSEDSNAISASRTRIVNAPEKAVAEESGDNTVHILRLFVPARLDGTSVKRFELNYPSDYSISANPTVKIRVGNQTDNTSSGGLSHDRVFGTNSEKSEFSDENDNLGTFNQDDVVLIQHDNIDNPSPVGGTVDVTLESDSDSVTQRLNIEVANSS